MNLTGFARRFVLVVKVSVAIVESFVFATFVGDVGIGFVGNASLMVTHALLMSQNQSQPQLRLVIPNSR